MPPPGVEELDLDLVIREVSEALAILHALEEGALLGDAPTEPEARRRHQSAVVLIELMREKLERLRLVLEAPRPAPRSAGTRHSDIA
jgi:hypothetical protein